jgi:holo-[acyl-carrier protein] synthase
MILGIGIDSVNIERFNQYHEHSGEMLLKIFSQQEIDYCLSKPQPAVHFAARFAAREAFFKAYQGMLHHYKKDHPATLLTINKNIEVIRTERGLPLIKADWQILLPIEIDTPEVKLSITHTDTVATAIVIMS